MKCTLDYENMHFNTGLAQIMVLVNELYKVKKLPKNILLGLAQLLAPVVPHLGQELYHLLGYTGLIDFVKWPSVNEDALNSQPVTYAVQVNGKLRGTLSFKKDATDEELEELKKQALSLEKVVSSLQGKELKKVIVVKNKIVSIVIK